jgi:hypothetical protein
MLGGGAGHIADMVARLKANQALSKKRKRKAKKNLIKSKGGDAPLQFRTISATQLAKVREKYRKKQQAEWRGITLIALFIILMLSYFFIKWKV